MNQKPFFLAVGLIILIVIGGAFLISIKPQFPVDYRGLNSVGDYINGNAIIAPGENVRFLRTFLYGWKDWTKEDAYPPLITEDDWIIVMIDSGKQKQTWSKEYSKEELIDIAQNELGLAEKQSDSWSYKKSTITRIQSFIDILSRR